jgi:hypothetical protein
MSLKLKEEMNCLVVLDTWIDHDSFVNIVGDFYNEHEKGSLWGQIFSFLFCQNMIKEEFTICYHNMLSLMLDLIFKNLILIYYLLILNN